MRIFMAHLLCYRCANKKLLFLFLHPVAVGAGLVEEALEVYFVDAVSVLFEAYRAEKSLVAKLAAVFGAVDAAKVDEIECAAAHYEKSLEVLKIKCGGNIVNYSARVGELELGNTRKHSVALR